MDEISIPLKVLKQAEEVEMRSQAEYKTSGEVIQSLVRRVKQVAIEGGFHGKTT